jgi:hypothetical protein
MPLYCNHQKGQITIKAFLVLLHLKIWYITALFVKCGKKPSELKKISSYTRNLAKFLSKIRYTL